MKKTFLPFEETETLEADREVRIPGHLKCDLSREIFYNPVRIIVDGKDTGGTFEKHWAKRGRSHPTNSAISLANATFHTDHEVAKQANDFLIQHPKLKNQQFLPTTIQLQAIDLVKAITGEDDSLRDEKIAQLTELILATPHILFKNCDSAIFGKHTNLLDLLYSLTDPLKPQIAEKHKDLEPLLTFIEDEILTERLPEKNLPKRMWLRHAIHVQASNEERHLEMQANPHQHRNDHEDHHLHISPRLLCSYFSSMLTAFYLGLKTHRLLELLFATKKPIPTSTSPIVDEIAYICRSDTPLSSQETAMMTNELSLEYDLSELTEEKLHELYNIVSNIGWGLKNNPSDANREGLTTIRTTAQEILDQFYEVKPKGIYRPEDIQVCHPDAAPDPNGVCLEGWGRPPLTDEEYRAEFFKPIKTIAINTLSAVLNSAMITGLSVLSNYTAAISLYLLGARVNQNTFMSIKDLIFCGLVAAILPDLFLSTVLFIGLEWVTKALFSENSIIPKLHALFTAIGMAGASLISGINISLTATALDVVLSMLINFIGGLIGALATNGVSQIAGTALWLCFPRFARQLNQVRIRQGEREQAEVIEIAVGQPAPQ